MQTTFPIRRRQSLGFLVSLCAFGALANCAKADIVAAQELPNGRVLVNNPEAYIGNEQNHVDTPWMIVSPDAKSGFANDFTTNAISVVSEDGTNFYAHIETKKRVGPRKTESFPQIIHFTVDENGIPSKTGELFDFEEGGMPEDLLDQMKHSKLIASHAGHLYFAPRDENGTYMEWFIETGVQDFYQHPVFKTSYQNESNLYVICGQSITHPNQLVFCKLDSSKQLYDAALLPSEQENTNMALTVVDDKFYVSGGDEGHIREGELPDLSQSLNPPSIGLTYKATLSGSVSGLSNNGEEVFATTEATNAFYNVTLGQYNVVKDENGNPTPMVPPTQEGLVRVIDNRKKGGKFLCVTATGILSVD